MIYHKFLVVFKHLKFIIERFYVQADDRYCLEIILPIVSTRLPKYCNSLFETDTYTIAVLVHDILYYVVLFPTKGYNTSVNKLLYCVKWFLNDSQQKAILQYTNKVPVVVSVFGYGIVVGKEYCKTSVTDV